MFLIRLVIAVTIAAILVGGFGGCASMANLSEWVLLEDVTSEPPRGPFWVGRVFEKNPYRGYKGVVVVGESGREVRDFSGRVLVEEIKTLVPGDPIYLQMAVLKRGRGKSPDPNFFRAIKAPWVSDD